nr:hypothetical protein [Desulfobulbaceae bacterium]
MCTVFSTYKDSFEGASEQAASLEETSASMEEISAASQETSKIVKTTVVEALIQLACWERSKSPYSKMQFSVCFCVFPWPIIKLC